MYVRKYHKFDTRYFTPIGILVPKSDIGESGTREIPTTNLLVHTFSTGEMSFSSASWTSTRGVGRRHY